MNSHGYSMLRSYLLLFTLMLAANLNASGQGLHEVSGSVMDNNRELLPGVHIIVQGTTTGATTDEQGRFRLTVPSSNAVLVFSFIGYQNQEVQVDGRSVIDVVLMPLVYHGDELIVVGYGTQRARDVTGSLGTVRMSNLEGVSLTSPDQALMGQIAGVYVTQTTGLPGSAPQIQVRGISTVTAGTQPLYVVDGFALPQPSNQVEARFRNPLADIAPQDIESITVLKDASATAIYGSRGSNGVVVITTKSGAAREQSTINISASSGVSHRIASMLPEMANAQEFAAFQKYIWEGRVLAGQATEVPEIYRNPEQLGEGTNWFHVVTQPARNNNVDISVSGGNRNLRSYFSGGVINQGAIVPGVDFTRLSFRANLDAIVTERLQAGVRLAPSYATRNQPGSGGDGRGTAFGTAMMMNPIVSAYDENGNLIPYPSLVGPAVPGAWTHPNPVFLAQNLTDERTTLRLLTNTYVNYQLLDGLVLRSAFNADIDRSSRQLFNPSFVGGTNNPPPTVPSGSVSDGSSLNWLSETTLNYHGQNFGPGSIDVLTGFTVQEQAYDRSMTFSGIFPDDIVRTLNVASNITGSSSESSWSLVSALGRVNYNLFDRYLITSTIRTDGSSRFGADNRWGVFPSAAVSWNISNEPFYGLNGVMPELRTRLSYGLTGNNQIGNYSSLGLTSAADYMFGNTVESGRALTSFANRTLGWEKTQEWNAGLDIALLNYRWNITLDAYNRVTSDMLLSMLLPHVSGFGSVTENIGSMRNRGLEIGINAVPFSSQNVSWSTDLNVTINRNKVLTLPDGEPILALDGDSGRPTHITQEGSPIGLFYGFIVEGVFQNMAEINSSPIFGGEVPGNLRFRDLNGDGRITPAEDFAVIGSPHPKFTFGWNQNLRIRNFDFRATFTGSYGGQVSQREYYRTAHNIDGLFNVSKEYANNFWRSEAEPGKFPSPRGGAQARGFFRTSHSMLIVSNSNVWLRNASIRYNIPNFLGLRSASVHVTGQNLLVLTGYRGNPDAQMNGGQAGNWGALIGGNDFLSFPMARSFNFGIELGL